MPCKTAVNWLFNDIWRYLIIGFFDRKIEANSCEGLLYPKVSVFKTMLHLKRFIIISINLIFETFSIARKASFLQFQFFNKKTLCVITIAMICSSLASLWKFQYFRRSICNLVEHLWWSFYCKNSEPLIIFTKKLHDRRLLVFWRLFQRFISLKNFTL